MKNDTNNAEFINLAETIKISADKKELALQIIALFIEELPNFKSSLLAAEKKNDREEIGRIIHKLFGACAICIAPSIKKQLDTLSAAYEAEEKSLLEHIITLNSAIDKTIEFCAENTLGA